MNTHYEVEYQYLDSLKEGWRYANLIVYDTNTVLGDTLDKALDLASDDGDYSGVEVLLHKFFGLGDDDVIFYFDRNGIEDESLFLEIQRSLDVLINKYTKIKEVE